MSTPRSHPCNESSASTPVDPARWWLAVPAIFLVAAFVIFRPQAKNHQDSPAIGKPAPQFDLVLLSDEPSLDRLQQTPAGKVTLLHFWGTWCGPCKMEYPELSEMANRLHSDPKFEFVPVSCESKSSETFEGLRAKTNDYFASQQIDSFSYCDPQGVTRRSTADRLDRQMMYYPTSVLIGMDGRIAGVWEGYKPQAVGQMQDTIERLTQY